MKKLEALNPFSGEEGFLHRGDRFETSEARANLLLRAGLVKELPEDATLDKPKPTPTASTISRQSIKQDKGAKARETKEEKEKPDTKESK